MEHVVVSSADLGDTWKVRHHLAMADPLPVEQPLVQLCHSIQEIARKCGQDGVLRDGVARLLDGAQEILAAEWGPRLDMGTVDHYLAKIADRIDYDRDRQVFRDES